MDEPVQEANPLSRQPHAFVPEGLMIYASRAPVGCGFHVTSHLGWEGAGSCDKPRYRCIVRQVLNPREFKEVLQASRLELDPHELRAIMAEVDENENGTVDYDEFMPVMVGLIMGMKAKQSAAEEICRAESSLKVIPPQKTCTLRTAEYLGNTFF